MTPTADPPAPDLSVALGRLRLANPILVASGTFGYAREFAPLVDLSTLGGVVPKTVTPQPRTGNPPPRTVETPAGMLNSIGLDNDGVDHFCAHHLPYLSGLGTAVIANVAGKSPDEFAAMAAQVEQAGGADAIELNVSCPNVSGGVDYGRTPEGAAAVVSAVRAACDLPILAKLTPNVTDVPSVAKAAAEAGADAVTLVNTFTGLAVNWRTRRPVLGNGIGGLSGPAIKPLALRIVYQVAQAVDVPIVGCGGIRTVDDVLEFLVCGASAVQVGTANFADPTVSGRLVKDLAAAMSEEGVLSVRGLVGTLGPAKTAQAVGTPSSSRESDR
ncbi:dihydroorotate dehydrogenase [Alienimonas chondri]|uniref:Dihydroorotate dehydrogenase n=1 Tax=Alienimonas chondri TaxID=2681879 RepID=A0ABX1VIA5_9PLAN|nr:dihydroorotate dehydrogenase [Alienimonas chondri]NNJ26536.1 Dihydroorotate dehydrogenase B (NAD(+)), catalytic subunit [Alienimonas chondri]